MKKLLNNSKIFPVLFFLLSSMILLLSNPNQESEKLAGKAIVPEKIYEDWARTQQDSSISTIDKIKSSVEAFFKIKHESWRQGILYDFGFLFDQENLDTSGDYVYERGLLYVFLEKWKSYGIRLMKYEDKPEITISSSNENKASVKARSELRLWFEDNPNKQERSPNLRSLFNLVFKNNQWLFKDVECKNPDHTLYPRGTDFNSVANDLPKTIQYEETHSRLMVSMTRRPTPRTEKILKRIEREKEGEWALSIEDVKKNYKFWQIKKITHFDDMYAIVESERPTLTNRFDFFDLKTGERQRVPSSLWHYHVKLHKISSPYGFFFYADGRTHINYQKEFPFIIRCSRGEKHIDFNDDRLARYFPLTEGVKFGGKSKADLKDIKVTLNGIEMSFGPAKGYEAEFHAAYTDIARTQTGYDRDKHQFIITLKETHTDENLTLSDSDKSTENPYIKSFEIKLTDSDCQVIINLKKLAAYYSGQKGYTDPSSNTPYAKFVFITEQDFRFYKTLELR